MKRLSEKIVNLNHAGENSSSSTGLEAPRPVFIPEKTSISNVPEETRISTAAVSSKRWLFQQGNEDNAAVMIQLFRSMPLSKQEETSEAKESHVPSPQTSDTSDVENVTGHGSAIDNVNTSSSGDNNTATLVSDAKVVAVVDEQSSVVAPRPHVDTISEYIQHVLQTKGLSSIEHLHNMSMIYLVDTGGQPEFHELLPVILRGSALYFIFFSLAYSLYQKVHVRYRLPEGDTRSSDITYDSIHSSIEMIHQLLSSFYSIHRREVEKGPDSSAGSIEEGKSHSAAVLLATYADYLDGADKQARLEDISRQLLQWLESCEFDKKFLTYSTSSPLIFTPIDNMYGEKQDISEFESFVAPIIENFPLVKLPRSFALFHLILQHKFESPGVCSLEEAIELGTGCGIERSDITTVLRYIHKHLGTILFYEEVKELREIVVINPNTLFRCLTEIIMESFAGTRSHETVAAHVRKTGEISDIERFKGILEGVGRQSLLTPYHMICLLKHFKLLQKMEREGEEVLFMPCLLKVNQEIIGSSYQAVSNTPIPSLLVHFKGGYIPVGMFSALIVTLTTSHGWELDEEQRYRNSVQFILEHFVLKLVVHPSFFEIRVEEVSGDMGKIHEACVAVQEAIWSCLEKLSSELPHLEKQFNLGYLCSGSKDSAIPLHVSIRKYPHKMLCTRSPRCHRLKDIDNDYQIWHKEWKVYHTHLNISHHVIVYYSIA